MTKRRVLGLWFAGLGILALGVIPPLVREAHSDIAWPMYLAGELLRGARQGIDFLEINPPLMLWLALPPVLLARMIGITAWHADVLLVAGLACLSLALAGRQLRALVREERARCGLMLLLGFTSLVLPRLEFGEREHLALLLTIPFTLLAATRLRGEPVGAGHATGIGIIGALGFALKPYFLLPWLLMEGLLMRRLGGRVLRRPECIALVITGSCYALCVMLLAPDYLPMAIRLGPWYDRYLNNGLLGTLALAGPFVLLLVLGAFAQRAAVVERDGLVDALGAACIGFFLAAVLQRKGFDYHFLPATGYGLVLLARGWQLLPRAGPLKPSYLLARASPALLAFGVFRSTADGMRELADPGAARYRADPSYTALLGAVRELARGDPIMVLSSNPSAAWPLTLDARVAWSSRYMSLWPLAALYDAELWATPYRIVEPRPLSLRTGFEGQFAEEVISDLERRPPGLIIVLDPDSSVSEWGGATRIDYLRYFAADPRFVDLLAGYLPERKVGRYRIWIRRHAS